MPTPSTPTTKGRAIHEVLAVQEVQQIAQEVTILRASIRSSTAMLPAYLATLGDLPASSRVIHAHEHAQAALASLLEAMTPWTR